MKFQKGDTVYLVDIETLEENPNLDSDTYPVIWRGKVTDIDENGNMHVDLEPNGLSPAVGVEGANIEDLFYRTPEEAVCEFLSDMRQKLFEQIKKLRGVTK